MPLLLFYQLFDYIASCIANFVKDHNLHDQNLPLGFTFSFPCRQESLAVGRLVQWTKGFRCAGVEGEDVVRLLDEAIKRRKVFYYLFCIHIVFLKFVQFLLFKIDGKESQL